MVPTIWPAARSGWLGATAKAGHPISSTMDSSGKARQTSCRLTECSGRLPIQVQFTSSPIVPRHLWLLGNADGPKQVGDQTLPIGPGVAYIYDLSKKLFVTNIVFPSSKSDTAYGIWQNGPTNYTICGGYSPLATNNLTDQSLPLTQAQHFWLITAIRN